MLAPNAKMKTVGIRPGEKLHEVLVTAEEARHTKEFMNYYVILPEHDWWVGHDYFSHGQDVTDGFYLASDNNAQWINQDEMNKLLMSL